MTSVAGDFYDFIQIDDTHLGMLRPGVSAIEKTGKGALWLTGATITSRETTLQPAALSLATVSWCLCRWCTGGRKTRRIHRERNPDDARLLVTKLAEVSGNPRDACCISCVSQELGVNVLIANGRKKRNRLASNGPRSFGFSLPFKEVILHAKLQSAAEPATPILGVEQTIEILRANI